MPDDSALSDVLPTWASLHDRPIEFVERLWPSAKLTDYQREILASVRDNNQTYVYSGHKMGKSLVAAMAALWFLVTRSPATVLLISASEHQLELVLWAEIARLLRTSEEKLPLKETRLRLRVPTPEEGGFAPRHELIGCAANKPESLQGHNLPRLSGGRPSVLAVCEEASAIPDRFIESLLPQAHRLLAIGNPLRVEGWFYAGCRAGHQHHPTETNRLLRWVRHISPEESPNIIVSRQMDRDGQPGPYPETTPGILSREEFDEWNASWTGARKRMRLFGLLPDEAEQKLFPPAWLDLAQRLGQRVREHEARGGKRRDGPWSLGVDVAQGGGDLTVWVVLGRWGVRHVLAKPTPNTAEISGQTIRLMEQFRIRPSAVAFDSGGGGKQIADFLRDRGHEGILDLQFGSTADDAVKYRNRRTELYGDLREAMEPAERLTKLDELPCEKWPAEARCISFSPDDGLMRDDLAVLPLTYDSEGRLRLPPKDHGRTRESGQRELCVRELLGGRSPDRGDALALAYYAWSRARAERRVVRVPVDRPLVW
jgi:hypothetical protein